MTKHKREARIGSIASGSVRPEDTIPVFAAELRRLRGAVPLDLFRDLRALAAGADDDDAPDAGEVANDLITRLGEYAPPFCYFGTHTGDGADFGFWVDPDFRSLAQEDGALIVEDTGDVPRKHRGYVLHINDHGNVTLYRSRGRGDLAEIWAIV